MQSIADGRSYVSDGRCHLIGFTATDPRFGTKVNLGIDGSELNLKSPGTVSFSTVVAALLDEQNVTVELIVNGYPVASKQVKADGSSNEIQFEHKLDQSSWVAVRVFPNAHTNPVYVVVDDQPIRGGVDSIRWCLAGVEQCWKSKQSTYGVNEQADATAAYQHARDVYADLIDQVIAHQK